MSYFLDWFSVGTNLFHRLVLQLVVKLQLSCPNSIMVADFRHMTVSRLLGLVIPNAHLLWVLDFVLPPRPCGELIIRILLRVDKVIELIVESDLSVHIFLVEK